MGGQCSWIIPWLVLAIAVVTRAHEPSNTLTYTDLHIDPLRTTFLSGEHRSVLQKPASKLGLEAFSHASENAVSPVVLHADTAAIERKMPPFRGLKTLGLGALLAAVLVFATLIRTYDPKTGEQYPPSVNLADLNRTLNQHLPAELRLNWVVAMAIGASALLVSGLADLLVTAFRRHKAKKGLVQQTIPAIRGVGLLVAACLALFVAARYELHPGMSPSRLQNTAKAIAALTGVTGLLQLIGSQLERSVFLQSGPQLPVPRIRGGLMYSVSGSSQAVTPKEP